AAMSDIPAQRATPPRTGPITPFTPEQYDLHLAWLLALADEAAEAVRVIHKWLPVEGQPWIFADSCPMDSAVVSLVLNALRKVEVRLNPDGLDWKDRRTPNATEDGLRVTSMDILRVTGIPVWSPVLCAVGALWSCHDAVLTHYGFAAALTGD